MSHQDVLIHALAAEGAVRVLATEVSDAAETGRRSHGLGRDASVLLAEGSVATTLLSAYLKGDERVLLQIQLERPRAAFLGDVGADGTLRLRLTPADVRIPADHRLDGILLAIKSDSDREVYRGHSTIDHSTLEQALRDHLATSNQVDVVLRIGTRLDEAGQVAFAGGLLVERLPEDPEQPSLEREAFLDRFSSLERADVEALMVELASGGLAGGEAVVLEHRPVSWCCRCSLERVESMLVGLGREELQSLAAEQGEAEVTCHFCNTTYRVDGDRLDELIAST